MGAPNTVKVQLVHLDTARVSRATSDLQHALEGLDEPTVQVERIKEDQGTQDFGSVLLLVLGTQATLAVAKGIMDWLKGRYADMSVEIQGPKGKIALRGAAASHPRDVETLARILSGDSDGSIAGKATGAEN